MIKDEKDILVLLRHIKTSPDGPEFIDYLEELSRQNYQAFKLSSKDASEIHKGYALAVDSLLELFLRCDQNQESNQGVDPDAHY